MAKLASTEEFCFGDLSKLSDAMYVRLVIFTFLLIGACIIWYPGTVEIGYTTLIRSGLHNKSVKLDTQRLSTLEGCRFVDLLNYEKSKTVSNPGCFRKHCLLETGRHAGVDYMLGGSLDRISTQLLISWRLIDVESGEYKQIKVVVVPFEAHNLDKQVHESLIAFIESWQNEENNYSFLSRIRKILSNAYTKASNGKTRNKKASDYEPG